MILLRSRSGMTLLISVLIMGAVALSVGASMAIRGIEEVDVGRSGVQTAETLAVTDACVEEALLQLKRTAGNFTGTTLAVGDGLCSVSVTGTLPFLTLHATGTVLQWEREVFVDIEIRGSTIVEYDWDHDPPSSIPSCMASAAPSCNGSTATVYVNSCNIIVGGPDDGSTYSGTLNGTAGVDIMVGTNQSDTINGNDSGDTICALGGGDIVNGGNGDDIIFGGGGDDALYGDGGADTICGESGHDTVRGDSSNDSLDGGDGTDTIHGDTQTDVCRNGEFLWTCEDTSGSVLACGTTGGSSSSASSGGGCTPDPAPSCNGLTATVYVDSCNKISGGPGDGNTYAGTLTGTSGNDVMVGSANADTINGNAGDDTICALAGNDIVNAAAGDDVVFGGDGDDTLDGANNDDTLCGEGGNDTLTGGNHADNLDGGTGTDNSDGENQSDVCRNGETQTSCEDTTSAIPTCGTYNGPTVDTASLCNRNTLSRASDLSFTFNEAMNAGTTSNFIVHAHSYQGTKSGTYGGGSTTTLTMNPTANFHYGEEVEVSLTTGLTDSTDSTPLEVPYVCQMRVATPNNTPDWPAVTALGCVAADAVGDFDGDGDLDVMSITMNTDELVWCKNNGDLTFSTQTDSTMSTSVWGNDPYEMAADLDNDGDIDVISGIGASVIPDEIYTVLNNGSGDFTRKDDIDGLPMTGQSGYYDIGDIDGDGDIDALVGFSEVEGEDSTDGVHFNDGTGIFTPGETLSGSTTNTNWVGLGDIDNDGDLDAVLHQDGDLVPYLNTGTGSFSAISPTTVAIGDLGYHRAQMGDVDNDGDLDIVGDKKECLNNGGGVFTCSATEVTTSWMTQLVDIDGDGDLDRGLANKTIEVRGGADITLTAPCDLVPNMIYDFNNDGFLDISDGTSICAGSGSTGCSVNSYACGGLSQAKSPSTFDHIDRTFNNWTNPSNIQSNNGAYATHVGVEPSNYLKATNFQFDLPAGADIQGIIVSVDRHTEAGAYEYTDDAVHIIKNDSMGSENKASACNWPTSDEINEYGGSADLWSETWVDTDIEASNFGVAFAAVPDSAESDLEARIDHIEVEVCYGLDCSLNSYTCPGSSVKKNPGTIINTDSGGDAWDTPGNAAASDDARTTNGAGANATDYLDATNFGIDIPTGHKVDGIIARVERRMTGSNPPQDADVRIIKGGTPGSQNKGESCNWSASEATQQYGGPSELWGETWTVADVEASNFGLRFSAQDPSAALGVNVEVDHIEIEVCHSPQGALGSSCNIDGMATTDNASVTFDRNMNNGDANSFFVQGTSFEGKKTYGTYGGAGSTTIYWDPQTSFEFKPGEVVEVTVTTGVTDYDDDLPIHAPYVCKGRVATPAGRPLFAAASTVSCAPQDPIFDYDGDGDLDGFYGTVVDAGQGDYELWWCRNDGNLSFTAVQEADVTPVGNNDDFIAADLDNDGDIDLLNCYADTNEDPSAYYTLFNDGSGQFTDGAHIYAPVSTVGGNDPGDLGTVDLGDVDGDGDLDFIAAGPYVTADDTGSQDKLFKNNGSGTFDSGTNIGGDETSTSVAVFGDIDDDGDLDIITDQDGSLTPYFNTGTGSFTVGTTTSLAGYNLRPDDCSDDIVGDIDNDGDVDIVGNNVECLNNGSGVFSCGSTSITTSNIDEYIDIDGDGDLDRALRNKTIEVRSGTNIDLTTGCNIVPEVITDLDGDGDLDISNGNDKVCAGSPSTACNDGVDNDSDTDTDCDDSQCLLSGDFYEVVHNEYSKPGYLNHSDFDGDGDLDVLSGTMGTFAIGQVRWYQNDGEHVPTFTEKYPNLSSGLSIQATVIDVDNDTNDDIVAVISPDIKWFENEGSGNFATGVVIVNSFTPTGIPHGADLNSDGDTDIVVAGYVDGKVYWLDNDGSETFTRRDLATVTNPTAVFTAKIDNDNHVDVVVIANGSVLWYKNDGAPATPAFTAMPNIGSASLPSVVHVTDINGDSSNDVIIGAWGSPTIGVHINSGTGGFGTAIVPTPTPPITTTLHAGDVNGDSDIDIVALSGDTFYWHEHNGLDPPSFTRRTIDSGTDVKDVHAVDLNGDGFAEVITAAEDRGDNYWGIGWYDYGGSGSCYTWDDDESS